MESLTKEKKKLFTVGTEKVDKAAQRKKSGNPHRIGTQLRE
jgi:hypothetical protein